MVAAGGAALIAVGVLTAGCSSNGGQSPSTTTTTTTTTTSPSPSATEKSISPTGGNLFTPGVTAPGAPSVQPGLHPGINGNN
jgi:hypothetical protein